jgi:ADP-ribose pyrophosphatase
VPTSKKLPYRVVESRRIHQGHIVCFVKDRFILNAVKDRVFTRELLLHPGAAVILPFIDSRHIILLKQFRYAAKGDLWEIPAGTLEKGEAPLRCAKREIEEETGFQARKWKRLAVFYPAPGISDELMTLYKAWDLVPGRKNLDHDEWIEHEIVSLDRALKMVREGKINDAKTIVGILWGKYLQ